MEGAPKEGELLRKGIVYEETIEKRKDATNRNRSTQWLLALLRC